MSQKNRRKQQERDDNPTLSQLPLAEKLKRLLDERFEQHEANPEDVELWEIAREKILDDVRQRRRRGDGICHESFWEGIERLPK